MSIKEEVLAILLMRFKIQLSQAIGMINQWFLKHPQANWETLRNLLKQNQIVITKGEIKEIRQTKCKILCIDDSPLVLKQIDYFLQGHNCLLFLLDNPVKALKEIIEVVPDIIMMDITMPGIDGYKLCRLIKNHPVLKITPVVMMTGNTGLIDRARAKMAGANDYLTKPFSHSEFLEIVSKYTH
jgi:two-component system, chemotaxis family, response regulator PixG